MTEKKCPCCTETELRRADRRGVEIDYCPVCNGIWLDCGELRKIVDATLEAEAECCAPADVSALKQVKQSKLKSFLSEIFGTTKDRAEDDDPDFHSDFVTNSSNSKND
jgi:Zn-finger nucleic acid-binding protein